MLQVLIRAAYLLRNPAAMAVVLLLSVGGACLVMVPLFGVPGYELGEAMATGVGILGGTLGIAAAFQERRLIQGFDPRPRRALRMESPLMSAWAAFAPSAVVSIAALVPPWAAAVAFAFTSTRCDPVAQSSFYPLLAVPSALVASAAGVFCGFAVRRALAAGALYALLVLFSGIATAWPLISGPQVYAFNHFAGYVPGPLYDEALVVRPGLLWFRLESLLAAMLVLALTSVLVDMKRGDLGWPRLRAGPLVLVAFFGAAVFTIEKQAEALGLRMTDRFLAEKLGGIRETAHFRIIYPRGKPKEELDRLARDAEFRRAQVQAFLGGAPDSPITLYLYRSPEEKQALVGAAHTQFAKPWRLEIHLNDSTFPNAGLKHELTHAMAAPFGAGPFRVTSRFGVLPVMGVIEGLAVAADNPIDELSLHEWAAAMRQQKLAPDVRSLFRFDAFYKSPAPRAYALAGSFLKYLADTYGSEKLRALYAHGDFQRAYQRSLDALAADWGTFLDSVPLEAAAVNQAFARFRRGSIFSRPCAREVAALQNEAADFLKSDPAQALWRFQRCAELQPDEPAFRAGEAKALERLDRSAEAARVLTKLADEVKQEPALEAEVAMAQADLDWRRHKLADAEEHLKTVVELKPSSATDRAARLKIAALHSHAGRAIWAYLGSELEELKLLGLKEALQADPEDPSLNYLLGRRLTQLGVGSLASGYLAKSLSAPLPQSIRREALRLKIEAHYLAGDCSAVKNDVGHLPDFGAAFKASAVEWQDRCDFEERAFNGPLVSNEPFR